MFVQIETIDASEPSWNWKRFFDRVWPLYQTWFLSEGELARTGYASSRSQLEKFMPELIPTYDKLCELAGGGDLQARFLSMVDPPPYLAGCSQLARTRGEPTLIRNYDYDPRYFDGKLMLSNWVRPVIGMTDCTWGLLDGMNADGLSACLSFGGRKIIGKGFGIPLVVRYVLETCTNVQEACDALLNIPVHMTYSITLLDADKRFATVHLAPDRDPVVAREAICTNHQLGVEWAEYADLTKTVERKQFLAGLLKDKKQTRASIKKQFLKYPLYHQQYLRSFGTLYSIAYAPSKGSLEVFWPERKLKVGFKLFEEQVVRVNLLRPVGRSLAK